MDEHTDQLLALYGDLGLHGADGATYAPSSCSHSGICWADEPHQRFPDPPPSCKGEIYRPWVGKLYNDTRMAVVGENFYEHGGFEEAVNLIRWAIPRLAAGVRRMNFGAAGYKGSLFQHRAALYAQAWLTADGDGDIPIGEVYDHIAFTNQVKCSPKSTPGSRSRPNEPMWSTCGRAVLARELAVLGARRVVVLGNSWNAGAFRAHVWPGVVEVSSHGRVKLLRSEDGRVVLVVPHPASHGGSAWAILDDVRAVLAS